MPRILEMKTDEHGDVWCKIERKDFRGDNGAITLLTDNEIQDMKDQCYRRIWSVLGEVQNDFDRAESVLFRKDSD